MLGLPREKISLHLTNMSQNVIARSCDTPYSTKHRAAKQLVHGLGLARRHPTLFLLLEGLHKGSCSLLE